MAQLSSSVSFCNFDFCPRGRAFKRRRTLKQPKPFFFGFVVAADAGSIYEPHPTFKYSWDPDQPLSPHRPSLSHGPLVDLGPHPADPTAQPFRSETEDEPYQGPNAQEKTVSGQEIYVYVGRGGYVHVLPLDCECMTLIQCFGGGSFVSTYTFWRFLVQIPLSDSEMRVQYSINNGLEMDFFVPGRNETMRLAAYSVSNPRRKFMPVVFLTLSIDAVQRVQRRCESRRLSWTRFPKRLRPSLG
jgi:hypothetical protein